MLEITSREPVAYHRATFKFSDRFEVQRLNTGHFWMTQPQNPQSPQPSPTPSQGSSQAALNTQAGKRTKKFLENCWETVDQIGKALMGDLWRTLYLSIQDAIALYLLLRIPDLIGKLIFGKSFSDFGICLQEDFLSPTRYACFIIVASDFLLWIVLAGRIIGRFWADLSELSKPRGGSGHGSKP
jgi:hypothetical protein